ncbi:MAG TPA: sugar ABC transporter ATP-binding protein, partial [Treponema sp.]|nr:sugar ABC transporter ATP-binding protein [Treponema sp.]
IIDTAEMNRRAEKVIKDFGLPIKPTAIVKNLSTAYQQMVEIMKAYSRENLKCICFDEPTASLSDSEINSLFSVIRKLRGEGKVVIYVSHRMKEIKQIADKVAIFKDGRFITLLDAKTSEESEMIKYMVGRDLGDIFTTLDRDKKIGDVLLEVKNVSSDYVNPVSFTLHKGEVLGFAGLVGAGRTEIMRAVIGADKMLTGEIYLSGKRIFNKNPHAAMKNGIVLVPEDRKMQGILANLDVANNIVIDAMDQNSGVFGVLNTKKESAIVDEQIKEFRIKTPNPRKKIVELSGGNQQKCIVARSMTIHPRVLILDEPTKGIDVGAKSEFYHMICRFAKQGIGVILISSELPEIIGLSDRIIVMKNHRISGEVTREDATEHKLLSLAMADQEFIKEAY